jgi:hypothetical protein
MECFDGMARVERGPGLCICGSNWVSFLSKMPDIYSRWAMGRVLLLLHNRRRFTPADTTTWHPDTQVAGVVVASSLCVNARFCLDFGGMARVERGPGLCSGSTSIRSIIIAILLVWSASVTWLLLTSQSSVADAPANVERSAEVSNTNYATLPPQKVPRITEARKNLRAIPEAKEIARQVSRAVKVESNLRANHEMVKVGEKLATKALTTAAACKTSPWGVWSPCTKTCGGGSKQRNRHVIQEARFGGMKCPYLVTHATCHAEMCPKKPQDEAENHKKAMAERCKEVQQPAWCIPNLPPQKDGTPNKNCKAWTTQCKCTCAPVDKKEI